MDIDRRYQTSRERREESIDHRLAVVFSCLFRLDIRFVKDKVRLKNPEKEGFHLSFTVLIATED